MVQSTFEEKTYQILIFHDLSWIHFVNNNIVLKRKSLLVFSRNVSKKCHYFNNKMIRLSDYRSIHRIKNIKKVYFYIRLPGMHISTCYWYHRTVLQKTRKYPFFWFLEPNPWTDDTDHRLDTFETYDLQQLLVWDQLLWLLVNLQPMQYAAEYNNQCILLKMKEINNARII